MTEALLVSLIAIVSWLVLASRSGELRRVGRERMLMLAGIWAGIFAIVILVVGLVRS